MEISLLLVEDNAGDALLIQRALERQMEQIKVTGCRTLQESKFYLSQHTFDLVVTDHHLPDGSGLDVINYIRENNLDLPVVVLTGLGREDIAVAAMKAGAHDYIRKETDHSHLQMLPVKLNEALKRHELEQEVEFMRRQQEQLKLLKTIKSTVATVNHEINNPLAIISGNAQFLLEMGRMNALGDDVMKPIEDIEEASRRISELLHKLSNLKEYMTRDYAGGESEVIDLRDP
jgi:DNA-binding NtrC family response regulator